MAKRRGSTEGSVFKRVRPSGGEVWVGVVSAGWRENGARRRITFYADSMSEVLRKLAEHKADAAQGVVADPGRLTLSDLAQTYAEHVQRTVRATTHALYEHALDHHVKPRLGGLRLSRLRPLHVLHWLNAMERDGVKPRARQIAFDVLRRCCDFGVGAGMLAHNPCARVKRPRAPRPEIKSLSAEQAKGLLAEARKGEAWVEAAVSLGLCGLRRGEAFGLSWRDVNLEAGRVRVRQALTETMGGTRTLSEPKTESSRREVPLPPFAVAALRRHRESLGATPLPSVLVFTTEAGSPVRFSNFSRRHFAPLAKRAGVAGVTYHALRHTAATLMLGNGVDVKTAQAVLGHSRASTTLDVYCDHIPANVDAAIRRLGAML